MTQILLIDDDDMIRRFITSVLTMCGYTVVEAVDGNEGIELYMKSPSDLVITDLVMPEKEGIQVIRELRQNFPQVKIIAISGGGIADGASYLEIAKAMGAHGTLSKPFKIEELLTVVQKVLDE